MKNTIPQAVLHRLPEYYRVLTDLLDQDILRVSSSELSSLTSYTASQIRQDLNQFGEFGQQGYGYKVSYLHKEIGDLLGISAKNRCVILGNSISIPFFLSSPVLTSTGLIPVACFDTEESPFSSVCEGTPVFSVSALKTYCEENRVDLLILACEESALSHFQFDIKVKGILNYTRKILLPQDGIVIKNACLSDSAMYINYSISRKEEL